MKLRTEAEAAKLWCPFTKRAGAADRLVNVEENQQKSGCIASFCMAWQREGEKGYCGLIGEKR